MLTVVWEFKRRNGQKAPLHLIWPFGWRMIKAGVMAFDLDPQCTLVDVCDVRSEDGYEPTFNVSTNVDELENIGKR